MQRPKAINIINNTPAPVTKAAIEAVKNITSSNPVTIGNAAKEAAIEQGASQSEAKVIGATATGAAIGANIPDIQKVTANQKIITISP